MEVKITKKEARTLINGLTNGIVPPIGINHIRTGRTDEIRAFLHDMDEVEDSSAAFRFVCGDYGSGKTFLLRSIRIDALNQGFVVMEADLSPDKRLAGAKGKGLNTYRDLLQKLSTKTRQEGGALESIMQKWIGDLKKKVQEREGSPLSEGKLISLVDDEIFDILSELSNLSYGSSFAVVLNKYWHAYIENDRELKFEVLRWIRGEFETKSDAKKALGVDRIIDDASWYEFLKLFAVFVTKAGYKGLLVFLDEGVNLYKITNKQARETNYEKLLTIYNDTLQGKAHNIGFFMSGTPSFIYDERRGLFSYEALSSRLGSKQDDEDDTFNIYSPVIRLKQLTPEEIRVLCGKLVKVHEVFHEYSSNITEEDYTVFINSFMDRLGTEKLLTPREIITSFLKILEELYMNQDATLQSVLEKKGFAVKSAASNPEETGFDNDDDDDFAGYTI